MVPAPDEDTARPPAPDLEPEPEETPPDRRPSRLYSISVLLVLVHVAIYGCITWRGGWHATEDPETLIRYGALLPDAVWGGEYWRLLSAALLHIGPYHLLINNKALFALGPPLEFVLGRRRFIVLYVASALAGTAASLLFRTAISAGASGALFGCLGAFLSIELVRHRTVRGFLGSPVARQVLFWLALNVAIGFTIEFMDNAAHLGGLAAGLLLGFGLAVGVRTPGSLLSKAVAGASIAAILGATAYAALTPRWDEACLPILALQQQERGDLAGARETIERAIRYGNPAPDLRRELEASPARAFEERGDWAGAREALVRAVRPGSPDSELSRALERLGDLAQRRKDGPEAALCYEAAIQADPGRFGPWRKLGRVRLVIGPREKAIAAFESALRTVEGGGGPGPLPEADRLYAAGELAEAAAILKEARGSRLGPDGAETSESAPLTYRLGLVHLRLGDEDDALAYDYIDAASDLLDPARASRQRERP